MFVHREANSVIKEEGRATFEAADPAGRDPSTFEWIRIHLLLNGRICKHALGDGGSLLLQIRPTNMYSQLNQPELNKSVQLSTSQLFN